VWWPHCSPVGPLTAVQPANTEPTTTWYYLPMGGVSRPRPSLTVAGQLRRPLRHTLLWAGCRFDSDLTERRAGCLAVRVAGARGLRDAVTCRCYPTGTGTPPKITIVRIWTCLLS
jgi:hypothetical protein